MEFGYFKVNVIFDDETETKSYGFPMPVSKVGYPDEYFKERISDYNFKRHIEMSFKIVSTEILDDAEAFKKSFGIGDDDMRVMLPYGF